MAGGTGDIAFRLAERGARVTVADINADMLDVGERARATARPRGPRLAGRECRDAELRRRELRRLHDRLRHPERDRHPRRAPRGASRAEARRPLLLPGILDQRLARLRRRSTRPMPSNVSRGSARRWRRTRTAIATWSNASAASRDRTRSRAMIARRRLRASQGRADPRRPRRHPQRLEDLTTSVTHVWRLLKWGRVLARHGALRGIERDPDTPPPVRRLARIARFGARIPPTPHYAEALQAIGPAAIKLGQALATRPDLVGEEAAQNLVAAPGRSAAGAVRRDQAGDRASVRRAARKPLRRVRPRAGRRRLDRPGPPRGHHRRPRRSRSRCCAPASRRISPARSRPMNGRRRRSRRCGGEAAAAAAAPGRRHIQAMDHARARPAARRPPPPPSCARIWSPSPAISSPRSTGAAPPRRVLTLEWIDGIKLTDREALIAAGHDLQGARRASWSAPSCARRWSTASSTPTSTRAICSRSPDGRLAAIDFGIMGRIDRRARVWLAEILYGLITGNYRRVAEIHFEAQYVPAAPQCRRVRDRAARRRRADARAAGQGHLASARCSRACSRSPAISTCRPSRTCCCCRRRW